MMINLFLVNQLTAVMAKDN